MASSVGTFVMSQYGEPFPSELYVQTTSCLDVRPTLLELAPGVGQTSKGQISNCYGGPTTESCRRLNSWSSFTAASNLSSMEDWSDEDTKAAQLNAGATSQFHTSFEVCNRAMHSSSSHTDLREPHNNTRAQTWPCSVLSPQRNDNPQAQHEALMVAGNCGLQNVADCVRAGLIHLENCNSSSSQSLTELCAARLQTEQPITLGCHDVDTFTRHHADLSDCSDTINCFEFTHILADTEDELALLEPAGRHLPFDLSSPLESIPKPSCRYMAQQNLHPWCTSRDTQDLLIFPASRLLCEADRFDPFPSLANAEDDAAEFDALLAVNMFHVDMDLLASTADDVSHHEFPSLDTDLQALPHTPARSCSPMQGTSDSSATDITTSLLGPELCSSTVLPLVVEGAALQHTAANITCTHGASLDSSGALLDALRSNSESFELQGRVLNLGLYLAPDAPEQLLDAVMDALLVNTRVQCLYLPSKCQAFGVAQLHKLTLVLQQQRVWALNLGDNDQLDMEAWEHFVANLGRSAVAYLCIPKNVQPQAPAELKNRIKDVLMANRSRPGAVHNPEVLAYMFQQKPGMNSPGSAGFQQHRPYATGCEQGASPRSLAPEPMLQTQLAGNAAVLAERSKRQPVPAKTRKLPATTQVPKRGPAAKKQKLTRSNSVPPSESPASPEHGQQSSGIQDGSGCGGDREVASRTKPSFADLVAKGMVTPGQHDFSVGGIASVSVIVLPTGVIQYNNDMYNSISSFALAAARSRNPARQACDGWKEVRWQGVRLEKLRCQYIETYMT